ncbi:MAG: hypothetical protein AAF721_06590, partial [Myxococcota bacterium]
MHAWHMGWAVGALVGLVAACGTPVTFMCTADDQCVLSGEPGICADDGQCAYPDPDCPSGYAYPPNSPSDNAGACVPGDMVADDSATGGNATSGSATGMASGEGDGTTGAADDGTTGAADDGTSAPMESDGPNLDTDTDGDPIPRCGDEVGDDFRNAAEESLCLPMLSSDLRDDDDEDIFLLGAGPGGPCEPAGYNANVTQGSVEVCLFLSCADAASASVVCEAESETDIEDGLTGCCSEQMAQGQFQCMGEAALGGVYVRVRDGENTGAC